MPQLIAYPFRLSGKWIATVEDGTEECYAGELACLIQTEPGERDLVPEYGMFDPTFTDFDLVELNSRINLFGPPIVIDEFTAAAIPNGALEVTLSFTIDEQDDDGQRSDDDYFLSDDSFIPDTDF